MLFFIAGFETSSTLLSFLANELAINPDIQKKLQSEIDEVYEKCNGKLKYNDLKDMKYTDMVVSGKSNRIEYLNMFHNNKLIPFIFFRLKRLCGNGLQVQLLIEFVQKHSIFNLPHRRRNHTR